MNKIKHYFTKHKVTLMVIPSAEKSIKQWKFNLGIAFFVLIGLIIINITLLINTITSNANSVALTNENDELAVSLLMTQDKIDSLQNINANKTEEIITLKNSLQSANDFLVARLEEMEQAQEYVSQLVVLFNQETASSLTVPTSRSFSRINETAVGGVVSENEVLTDDEHLFLEIEALTAYDEISTIINEQAQSYTDLVAELESQLKYLDSRPDFYPTTGTFSSPFGYRRDPITGRSAMHNGIDISGRSGTSIFAAGKGIVTFAGYDGNYGRVIIIDHGYGYESVYAHCKSLLYQAGDVVSKGDKIATMGTSGRTTGTHLHFEIRYNGTPINPMKLLNVE